MRLENQKEECIVRYNSSLNGKVCYMCYIGRLITRPVTTCYISEMALQAASRVQHNVCNTYNTLPEHKSGEKALQDLYELFLTCAVEAERSKKQAGDCIMHYNTENYNLSQGKVCNICNICNIGRFITHIPSICNSARMSSQAALGLQSNTYYRYYTFPIVFQFSGTRWKNA